VDDFWVEPAALGLAEPESDDVFVVDAGFDSDEDEEDDDEPESPEPPSVVAALDAPARLSVR
jgi:hypothetical protein